MNGADAYPNAPLVLAAFEARHGVTPPMTAAQDRAVRDRLGHLLPAVSRIQAVDAAAPLHPDGSVRAETVPRFTSRDRTVAVTFRSTGLVVEMSEYVGWSGFSQVIQLALEARELDAETPSSLDRVGLRYIDEIRVPDVEGQSASAWCGWVDDSLLGPVQAGRELGFAQGGSQGLVSFRTPAGTDLVLRYGAREGFAVDPNGELRRRTSSTGAYFLLDIDSFWTPEELPSFSTGHVMDVAHALHSPVRGLFERVITDRLRKEVLANG